MTETPAPLVYSVVIPAYNASGVLPACLEGLKHQTTDRAGEVIVVDDGSSDDTVERARAVGLSNLRVLTIPHTGKSKARNMGLAAARGEIVLFTDADCVPAPDWVERILAPFSDPRVAGAKGVYRTRQPEIVARFIQAEFEEKYDCLARAQRERGQIEFVDTNSAAYRRSVLSEIGGFDETFIGAEDAELSFRVVDRGYRLVYAGDAFVYHHHQTGLRNYLERKASYAFWRARVYRRFPGKMARDSYTPRTIPVQMATALLLTGTVVATPLVARVAGRRTASALLRTAGIPALIGFAAATLPFAARNVRRDPKLAAAIPALVFLRALVQGVSLPLGLVRWALSRIGPTPG